MDIILPTNIMLTSAVSQDNITTKNTTNIATFNQQWFSSCKYQDQSNKSSQNALQFCM